VASRYFLKVVYIFETFSETTLTRQK